MIPLRTIHLAGFPLRIYASPVASPDHPWASFVDLMAIAGKNPVEWLPKVQPVVPTMFHTLPDGTILVGQPIVSGLFLGWADNGVAAGKILHTQWAKAWTDLFAMEIGQFPREQWQRITLEAEFRNIPYVAGETVMH